MKVIVVGAGKVGYYLSKTLLEHGHHPVVIEKDKNLCRRVSDDLDIPTICGDGANTDTLEAAGTRDAGAIICVTGKDEANLIACQLARRVFNVGRTVARVNNPKNAAVMKQLGVDIPVSTTDNIARLIEREVDSKSVRQVMSLNRGAASISELQLPADYELNGTSLSDLKLPEDCVIASITRDGEFIIPRGKTQIFSGDQLLVVSQNKVLHELSRILKLD